jgi:hypothetical protein
VWCQKCDNAKDAMTAVHSAVLMFIQIWSGVNVLIFKVHCKKDYIPQESGSMERTGLKMHITFHWLHALLMSLNYLYNERHTADETSYTF